MTAPAHKIQALAASGSAIGANGLPFVVTDVAEPTRRGIYYSATAALTLSATAASAGTGFTAIVNPATSCTVVRMRHMAVRVSGLTAAARASAPRLTVERHSVATAAQTLATNARMRRSSMDRPAIILGTTSASVAGSGAGLTLRAFLVSPLLTGAGATQGLVSSWTPTEEECPVLDASELVMLRQADNGSAGENRVVVVTYVWSEEDP